MTTPETAALSTYQQFQTYDDAAEYTAATGKEPPYTNSKLPLKRFVGSGNVKVFNGSYTNPGLVALQIPAEQNDVNFPGVVQKYPQWVPPPTEAAGKEPGSLSRLTIAQWLSTLAQAQEFAALVPGTKITERTADINYGAETRRVYQLTWPNGLTNYAGEILTEEFKDGAGRVGRWDVSGGSPVWVSEPASTGAVAPGPEVPTPYLLPDGAKLVSVGTGAGLSVVQVQVGGSVETVTGTIGGRRFTLTLEA